jgi:osmoprotectant transport system permease protein
MASGRRERADARRAAGVSRLIPGERPSSAGSRRPLARGLTMPFFDTWQQFYGAWMRSEDFWPQTLTFLTLTLRGLGVVLLLGIPSGMLLTRLPRLAAPVNAVLAMLQTVPSLALIGLVFPLVGIGAPAAIFAAVAYSLFPVVLNTYVGITQVPLAVRDAARGMGMTDRQILLKVELPLALPVILAGVRTGAVYAIGIVTIAALLGAGGLGDYIVTGMARGDNGSIFLGVLPILVITLVFFWGLGGIAWVCRRNNTLGLVLGSSLIALLAGYAVAEPLLRARRADVVLGAKNFTAGRILSEIFRLMLHAHTDLTTDLRTNLNSKAIYKAILHGDIDLYPEYTGNLLTAKDALDLPVPANKATITPLVRKEMPRLYHLVVLDALGLNDTYVPCTTRALAERYHLKTTSDLRHVPEFRVVVDLEFKDREDGWKGMVKAYDLHFQTPPTRTDPGLLYRALQEGQADLVIGFATDWQIDAYKLVPLVDDRDYFPSYHGVPLVRESILQRHPEIATVLDRLAGQIDDAAIRRMNYQVAVQHRSEAEVAREFLRSKGLIP